MKIQTPSLCAEYSRAQPAISSQEKGITLLLVRVSIGLLRRRPILRPGWRVLLLLLWLVVLWRRPCSIEGRLTMLRRRPAVHRHASLT